MDFIFFIVSLVVIIAIFSFFLKYGLIFLIAFGFIYLILNLSKTNKTNKKDNIAYAKPNPNQVKKQNKTSDGYKIPDRII